jgi:methyltransferase
MPDLFEFPPSLAQLILGVVLLQRLAELYIARRNTERLLAAGGVEHSAGEYPLIVMMHAVFLAALVYTVPSYSEVNLAWLAVYVALQVLRVWTMASLGRYWTTRIITLPREPLVRSGPYRYVRHPNYIVVVGEIAVLPLIFDQYLIAAVFTVLNAGLLYQRIRTEDAVLAERRVTAKAGNSARP